MLKYKRDFYFHSAQIHVVDETRHYTEWAETVTANASNTVGLQSGIIAAKRALNKLHFELGLSGFNQV
jgi:glycogen debranching enzyme